MCCKQLTIKIVTEYFLVAKYLKNHQFRLREVLHMGSGDQGFWIHTTGSMGATKNVLGKSDICRIFSQLSTTQIHKILLAPYVVLRNIIFHAHNFENSINGRINNMQIRMGLRKVGKHKHFCFWTHPVSRKGIYRKKNFADKELSRTRKKI